MGSRAPIAAASSMAFSGNQRQKGCLRSLLWRLGLPLYGMLHQGSSDSLQDYQSRPEVSALGLLGGYECLCKLLGTHV